MDTAFDSIIVGLGAMGSAAAFHLARRGARVLGLEARTAAHDKGSSHGESRIIRQAYFEHPAYVPLVQRAYQLWKDLEAESGQSLMTLTGGLAIGPASGSLITGCLTSARLHHLAHELLDRAEVSRRYPQFVLNSDEVAVYEPTAGYLAPEDCIRQHLRCAAQRGADLRFQEPVLSWEADGEGVRVVTANGAYGASSLVLSAGPWTSELLPALRRTLAVVRRVMFWIRPAAQPSTFDKEAFPIFLWEPQQGPLFYGFPRLHPGGDPKVAIHFGAEAQDEPCTPATIDRTIRPGDEADLRSALATRIPALNGEITRATTCMYTMTPDAHFVIDTHPLYPQVAIAAGFSGHGFKFSSAVGEILSDLALERRTLTDIALFSASRFH
ncbi:N-methyl-L-tryptophan oxidase [Acidobacteria bacterium AB60]|nr:N-methyl-L-tryptophan oxidase [Acidobacteria bacterium AB60]